MTGQLPVEDGYALTAYQRAVLSGPGGWTGPAARVTFTAPRPPGDHRGAVRRAVAELVAAEPALRTVVSLGAGPGQLVRAPRAGDEPGGGPVVWSGQLSAPGAADPARALRRWREASWQAPLADACRFTVHDLPEGMCVTVDVAGPVLDPVSGRLLADRLLTRLAAGEDHREPAPGPGMREAVAAEYAALDPAIASGHPVVPWPPASSVGADGHRATGEVTEFPAPAALAGVAARLGVPVAVLFLTAYLRALGTLTGRARVGTTVVVDGRAAAGVDPHTLGEFRVGVPVTVHRDARHWAELVRRVAAGYPDADPYRSAASADPAGPAGGSGFGYRAHHPPAGPGVTDLGFLDRPPAELGVVVAELTDGWSVTVRRTGGAAAQVATHLRAALAELAGGPDGDPRHASLGEQVTVSPGAPSPGEQPLPAALMLAHADSAPDSIAIIDGDRTVSYRELRDRVHESAARLGAAGLRPGELVGVRLPRSGELIVSLLGVLAAGGAFLPLDPEHPRQRSADALADAGARLLLVDGDGSGAPSFAGEILRLPPAGRPVVTDHPRPPVTVAPDQVAYTLFTSGSTGRPKGVDVPHRALANLLNWSTRALRLGPGDRVAQRTPVAFDAAIWELFAPLAAGATVVVVPPAASREAALLEAALRETGVTVVQLVPSLLAVHVPAGTFGRCPELRMVLCGGEALPGPLAAEFAESSDATLVNVYGPTECTVDAAWWHTGAAAGADTVPIGRPVDGLRLQVRDEVGGPSVPGVPGELWIGGVQLAHGYRRRPAATAERFVPDHLSRRPGGRLYRTGDRVRRLPGGELEFLGRLDDQVKIRGVRTETGEVAAVLAGHPALRGAEVVAHPGPGGLELVAYVVPAEPSTTAELTGALRTHLRERLPEMMIPAAFVTLPELPLLPNGKVDRARLPAPRPAEAPPYRPPADPAEARLATLLAELLAVDAVGRDDDLAALGVDALIWRQVAARLAAQPDRPAPAAPTLAAAARWLSGEEARR